MTAEECFPQANSAVQGVVQSSSAGTLAPDWSQDTCVAAEFGLFWCDVLVCSIGKDDLF